MKNRRVKGPLKTVFAALALVAVVAPAASAVTSTYATGTSPQYASGYGSEVRSYGTWVIYDRTESTVYSGLSAYYKYSDADNHKAYTSLNVTGKSRTSGATFNYTDDSSHENIVSGAWSTFSSPAQMMFGFGTAGITDSTGAVKTCLDIPWRFDPCSTTKTISTSF